MTRTGSRLRVMAIVPGNALFNCTILYNTQPVSKIMTHSMYLVEGSIYSQSSVANGMNNEVTVLFVFGD